MNLLHFKNRLKQLVLWISQGKYHLLSSAAFIITVFYLTGILKFYPNAVAIVMTLAGLLIILTQQILDATKFGSHKPNTFTSWIKSFPSGKPVSLSVNGMGGSIDFGKARVTVSIAADSTIERKVDFLLSQVAALDSAIAKLDDRVDSINLSLNKTEKKLQASLDTLSTSLNSIIASHIVGSYDLNLFGINIAICGTVIQFFCS
ncbi:MAG: hypothetical protein A2X56_07410 [Nitrospirae bacterium GWC2_57_13]|nr:MAG: hypothetical protein A2X56_07410 [Nitrospirae bacterium GWC2_57_13]OGW45448.1 MAG: hypothetical protein A2X57_08940 [Nitrospirae bacterium GWD2_57_8]